MYTLERSSKGRFSKIRSISKEVCRIFAFVSTISVLIRKSDKSSQKIKRLPCVKGAVSVAD